MAEAGCARAEPCVGAAVACVVLVSPPGSGLPAAPRRDRTQRPDEGLHLAGGEPKGSRRHLVGVILKDSMEDIPVSGKSGVYRVAVCGAGIELAPPVVVGGGRPARRQRRSRSAPCIRKPSVREADSIISRSRSCGLRGSASTGSRSCHPHTDPLPTIGGNRERAAAIHSALKGGGRPAGVCAAGVTGVAAVGAAAGLMARAAR